MAEIDGAQYKIIELAEMAGRSRNTIVARVAAGLPLEDIIKHDKRPGPSVAKAQVASAAARSALTHCKHGHEFTPENTYIKPNGYRNCRKCRADANARSHR